MDRLMKGSCPPDREIMPEWLYDREKVYSHKSEMHFYRVVLGSGTPAKTLADTNVRKAEIPPGKEMWVRQIRVEYIPVRYELSKKEATHIFDIINDAVFEVHIAGKDYFLSCRLSEILFRMTMVPPSHNNFRDIGPYLRGTLNLSVPIYLPSLTPYGASIHFCGLPIIVTEGDAIAVYLGPTIERVR